VIVDTLTVTNILLIIIAVLLLVGPVRSWR